MILPGTDMAMIRSLLRSRARSALRQTTVLTSTRRETGAQTEWSFAVCRLQLISGTIRMDLFDIDSLQTPSHARPSLEVILTQTAGTELEVYACILCKGHVLTACSPTAEFILVLSNLDSCGPRRFGMNVPNVRQ